MDGVCAEVRGSVVALDQHTLHPVAQSRDSVFCTHQLQYLNTGDVAVLILQIPRERPVRDGKLGPSFRTTVRKDFPYKTSIFS
jgi:hypothetical protein